jgi:hypothetical protein
MREEGKKEMHGRRSRGGEGKEDEKKNGEKSGTRRRAKTSHWKQRKKPPAHTGRSPKIRTRSTFSYTARSLTTSAYATCPQTGTPDLSYYGSCSTARSDMSESKTRVSVPGPSHGPPGNRDSWHHSWLHWGGAPEWARFISESASIITHHTRHARSPLHTQPRT